MGVVDKLKGATEQAQQAANSVGGEVVVDVEPDDPNSMLLCG